MAELPISQQPPEGPSTLPRLSTDTNSFMEPATHLTPLLLRLRSSSRACTKTPYTCEAPQSLTPITQQLMTQQSHMTIQNSNPSQDQDTGFKMLKDLLNQGIKPAIKAQSQALETVVTQKLITTLSTITTNQAGPTRACDRTTSSYTIKCRI